MRLVSSSSAIAIALVVGALAASPAGAAPIETGAPPDCSIDGLAPAVLDPVPGPSIDVNVVVLLDGVTLKSAQETFAAAQEPYQRLGIRLVTDFINVNFTGDDANGLIAQAQKGFGGARPPWADVVYLLTSKDIQLMGNYATAGLSSCIGGVSTPAQAFSVGEGYQDPTSTDFLGLSLFGNTTGKIAAHEIGHLFGAQHHYANCAESQPPSGGDDSPCTLMINDVGLASLRFGSLEGAVIRGYAERFVTHHDGPPPTALTPAAPVSPPSRKAGSGPTTNGSPPSGQQSSPAHSSSGNQTPAPSASSGSTTPRRTSPVDRRVCARAGRRVIAAGRALYAARIRLSRARGAHARRAAARRLIYLTGAHELAVERRRASCG